MLRKRRPGLVAGKIKKGSYPAGGNGSSDIILNHVIEAGIIMAGGFGYKEAPDVSQS